MIKKCVFIIREGSNSVANKVFGPKVGLAVDKSGIPKVVL